MPTFGAAAARASAVGASSGTVVPPPPPAITTSSSPAAAATCGSMRLRRVAVASALSRGSSTLPRPHQQPSFALAASARRRFVAASASASAAPSLAAATPRQSSPRPKSGPGGALQRVPVVSPPEELLVSALKRASRIGPSPGAAKAGGGEAAKERSRAARQLDALMKELSVPLGRYVAGFPPPPYHLIVEAEGQAALPSSAATNKNNNNTAANALHPFDAALLDLTVAGGARGYAACLKRVDSLRKSLQQTGKQLAGRASSAANAAAARQLLEEGTAELERLFSRNAGCVRDLANAARRLRRLPQVDPTLPTVALVGAPNVGKSSLVRRLSSGAPTVCDYPFTTRSVALGHFYAPRSSALEEGNDDDEEEQEKRQKQQSLRRHQVTDTPGLLDRDDPERNAMERLTLACVAHLPEAAVLFVVDLTEGCGQSVAAQWRVRTRLRRAFPDRAWVDVVSKADLLEPWAGEEEREEGGGEKSSGESVAALMAAAAEAELAVEREEAPIGQRGGALEYERAVRLAAAVREARARAAAGGGGGGGGEEQQQQQRGLLAPPLAVVRVSTMDDDDASLDGLKHAVLRAIAWAEKQEQRRRAAEVV